MPKVKAGMACPVCGATSCVKRTRVDGRSRLVRYRKCLGADGHRFATRESPVTESTGSPGAIGTTISLNALMEAFEIAGISLPSSSATQSPLEN